MNKYALIIDHISCWGCKTCEVACKQENDAPEGVKLIAVFEDGLKAVDDKTDVIFQSKVCIHCADPACVESCPEEAISQRDDGIVVLEEETCNGCQLCLDACPYHAISFDTQEMTWQGSVTFVITGWITGLYPLVPIMFAWLTAFISGTLMIFKDRSMKSTFTEMGDQPNEATSSLINGGYNV